MAATIICDNDCIYCGEESTTHDEDGFPLCADCADSLKMDEGEKENDE